MRRVLSLSSRRVSPAGELHSRRAHLLPPTEEERGELPANGSLETVQIYGEKGTANVAGGRIELTLTGAPQYVVVRAGK